MTRRTKRIVEQPAGLGTLAREDGTVIGQRRYALVVWQEQLHLQDSGGASTVDGLREITGSVTFEGDEEWDFVRAGTRLVLTLEDGRRVSCFAIGDGTIAATGPLQ